MIFWPTLVARVCVDTCHVVVIDSVPPIPPVKVNKR